MDLKDIAPIAIILVISAIIISIGTQILGEVKTSDTISTTTVTNESQNFAANNTYYAFDTQPVKSVKAMYYFSNTTFIIPSTYYAYTTGNAAEIKIYTNSSVAGYPNITATTYYFDYTTYDIAYNITEKGQEGLESLGDWLPTIALVVAAVIVIGTIMGFLAKKQSMSM